MSIGRPAGSLIPMIHPPAERWDEEKGMWMRVPGANLVFPEDSASGHSQMRSGEKSPDISRQQE